MGFPQEIENDISELPFRMRQQVRALLQGPSLPDVALQIGVSKEHLYNVRSKAIRKLGPEAPLSRSLAPRMARNHEIDRDSVRCTRCFLRGHTADQKSLCLPHIDDIAQTRY